MCAEHRPDDASSVLPPLCRDPDGAGPSVWSVNPSNQGPEILREPARGSRGAPIPVGTHRS